jgi:hypothetical protein
MSFRQAAARFSAEVERAMTRARRAAREARAEAGEFRNRNDELAGQAKTGKLKGVRRAEVAPTDPAARADAARFRTDNGLPVPDLPSADDLVARLPGREPAPRGPEQEDFSNDQVLFDIDKEALAPQPVGPARNDSPEPDDRPVHTRRGAARDDFSHERILVDATEETYRPDAVLESVFEVDDRDNRR